MPHCGGIQARAVWRPRACRYAVSARRQACRTCLREMPSPGRVGHTIQNQLCALHGLPPRPAKLKCHLPAGSATRYKITFARCRDCHPAPHTGQFAAAPHLHKCESCHTVQGFQPSTFTLAQHQSTRFPLAGGHVAVACVDCHKADARWPGQAIPFRFEDRSCTACHDDPHGGQFLERMRKPRPDGGFPACEACHVVKSWRELSRFDHSTTSFKLLGAHRAVPCASCHKPEKPKASLKTVDFRSAPSRCEDCHEEVHGGQFAAPGQLTNCASCHNSTKWKPSLFDHETGSTFSLQGAHQEVACALCHKTIRQVNGKPVLFYKPTPRECAACHGAAPGPKGSSGGQQNRASRRLALPVTTLPRGWGRSLITTRPPSSR